MVKKYKPFELEIDALGYHINRVFFSMIKLLNKEIKNSGLDFQHAEFTILKILIELKGASQTQIAAILGKERSAITRSVISLENKGYIKREPLNGSTNYVTMTEKGEEIAPIINEIKDRVTDFSFKGFSTRSRLAMINNLEKIYKNTQLEDK